jgi:hypothetical protein
MDKKSISNHLRDAVFKEGLPYREVAACLGIKGPYYISMALNHKHWDSISKAVWKRLEEWYLSGEPIRNFKPKEFLEFDVIQKEIGEAENTNKETHCNNFEERFKEIPEEIVNTIAVKDSSCLDTEHKIRLIISIEVKINNQNITINE